MNTGFLIYCLEVLDTLIDVLNTIAFTSLIVYLVSKIKAVLSVPTIEKQKFEILDRISKTSLTVTVVGFVILTFLPSPKTLAAMYVVPAIVNNEKAQAIGSNGFDILLEHTEEWVKDLKTSKYEEE